MYTVVGDSVVGSAVVGSTLAVGGVVGSGVVGSGVVCVTAVGGGVDGEVGDMVASVSLSSENEVSQKYVVILTERFSKIPKMLAYSMHHLR